MLSYFVVVYLHNNNNNTYDIARLLVTISHGMYTTKNISEVSRIFYTMLVKNLNLRKNIGNWLFPYA